LGSTTRGNIATDKDFICKLKLIRKDAEHYKLLDVLVKVHYRWIERNTNKLGKLEKEK